MHSAVLQKSALRRISTRAARSRLQTVALQTPFSKAARSRYFGSGSGRSAGGWATHCNVSLWNASNEECNTTVGLTTQARKHGRQEPRSFHKSMRLTDMARRSVDYQTAIVLTHIKAVCQWFPTSSPTCAYAQTCFDNRSSSNWTLNRLAQVLLWPLLASMCRPSGSLRIDWTMPIGSGLRNHRGPC